jgi:hypothetical protein
MTDTIDNILSDLTDLTLTAANAGVIKAAITRAKERLAALAQPKEATPPPSREEVLAAFAELQRPYSGALSLNEYDSGRMSALRLAHETILNLFKEARHDG